jgi:hypothetical protein
MSLKLYNIVTLYLNVLTLKPFFLEAFVKNIQGKNKRVAVTAKKCTKPISKTFKEDSKHKSIMLEDDQAASGKTCCGDCFLCTLCLKVVFAASKQQTLSSDASGDDTEEKENESEGKITFLIEKPRNSRHVNIFFVHAIFFLPKTCS